MEAVVLAISHFHGVSHDPLPSPPAREKSESSFYGDRVSCLQRQDGARGAEASCDGNSAQDNSSLKRVAVVEDFFDIIYAMHVEMGADPGRAPKHAGQKKTYKAVTIGGVASCRMRVFVCSCSAELGDVSRTPHPSGWETDIPPAL
ncbi:hypothetical protein NQZ68_025039 [Dissostichus eleginoides]|nr:hypothetical protein NQZ68_025039 [Dissostichus eleginoides]